MARKIPDLRRIEKIDLKNKEYLMLSPYQYRELIRYNPISETQELIDEHTPRITLARQAELYNVYDALYLLVDHSNYQFILIRDDDGEIWRYTKDLLKGLINEAVTAIQNKLNIDLEGFDPNDLDSITYGDHYYGIYYPDLHSIWESEEGVLDKEVIGIYYEGGHYTIIVYKYRNAIRAEIYSPYELLSQLKDHITFYYRDYYQEREEED